MKKYSPIFHLFVFITILLVINGDLSAGENLMEEGVRHYQAENFEEALEFFLKTRNQQPTFSLAAFYLGMTHKQMGNYREASKNLKDSITLTPPVKDAYPELIEALYYLNELKEAKNWINRAEKEGVKPAPVAFLKGLILLKEGKNTQAIEALKRAKEMDPSLTQPADFQIAIAHAKEKRFKEANESLKAVISMDPVSELASFAKEYERSFTKTVQTYKAWRFLAGVSYQYDDNVVLKPSTSIPGVAITGEADSSIVTNLKAEYTPLLGNPWFFSGQLSFYSNTYFEIETHRVIAPTLSLIPGIIFQGGAFTLPVSYGYMWLKDEEYASFLVAKPTLNITLLPNHIGQLSAGYTRREMLQKPISEDENRDGNLFLGSVGYIHPFSGGKGVFNLRYEFSRDKTEGVNWDNWGHHGNLDLLFPVVKPVSLIFSGEIFFQNYINTHTVFEEKRRDRTYTGTAGIIWEVVKGFNVNLRYSHTRAVSNIDLYDYRRNVYMAGIEFNF